MDNIEFAFIIFRDRYYDHIVPLIRVHTFVPNNVKYWRERSWPIVGRFWIKEKSISSGPGLLFLHPGIAEFISIKRHI